MTSYNNITVQEQRRKMQDMFDMLALEFDTPTIKVTVSSRLKQSCGYYSWMERKIVIAAINGWLNERKQEYAMLHEFAHYLNAARNRTNAPEWPPYINRKPHGDEYCACLAQVIEAWGAKFNQKEIAEYKMVLNKLMYDHDMERKGFLYNLDYKCYSKRRR
jgi:hypothetical protein